MGNRNRRTVFLECLALTRTVFLCGVSGVGKTTLASKVRRAHPTVKVVSAGDLVEQAAVQCDFSRAQIDLAYKIQNAVISARNALVVGHLVLPTSSGPVDVPIEAIKILRPAAILIVLAGVRDIAKRSKSRALRTRQSLSESEIHQTQVRESELAAYYAYALRVEYFKLFNTPGSAMTGMIEVVVGALFGRTKG